jgi:hypothetical protein
VRRSKGVCEIKKKRSKEDLLGTILDLGVREGHTILIWGYAEGYNFDLGVRGYQKVENPWLKSNFDDLAFKSLDDLAITSFDAASFYHFKPRRNRYQKVFEK